MQKKYIVRLSTEEREQLEEVIKKLSGNSQKVRRAQVLLKADVEGAGWTDRQIAEAYGCTRKTVENIRQRLVEQGFEAALNGQKRTTPRKKLLDGEQEAQVIALRLSPPPPGYASWSLRLLARKVVELEIVGSISHETLRQTLKKTG
ncbi:MAG: helix-turn-helix domain-containing protein [Geitlerinemataceae cyanobacterium]